MKAHMSMEGKKALITGGSKGLGAAIATTFAQASMDVAIIGRNQHDLAAVQAEIKMLGRSCWTIVSDLSDVKSVYEAGEKALAISKQWDIIVHSAGTASNVPLLNITEDQWDMMQHVNLRSIVFLCQKIVPGMIERKSGKIIHISSLAAFTGTPGFSAYAASKGGLNQLTRTMACEWGPYNIQTNAICPTIIMTQMGREIWQKPDMAKMREEMLNRIPLKRFGEPQEVAALALFLASPSANFLNGLCIPLDGGKLCSP